MDPEVFDRAVISLARPRRVILRASLGAITAAIASRFGARPVSGQKNAAPELTPFKSPTWGFSLAWDAARWTIDEQASLIGQDIPGAQPGEILFSAADAIALNPANGDGAQGYLRFVAGRGSGGQPETCLSNVTASLAASSTSGPLVQAVQGGLPLGGIDDHSAYGVFLYSDPYGEWATYLDCRELVPGDAMLLIWYAAPPASFNNGIPLAQDVIATLAFSVAASQAVNSGLVDPRAGMDPANFETPAAAPSGGVTPAAPPLPAGCEGIETWFSETRIRYFDRGLALEPASAASPTYAEVVKAVEGYASLASEQAGATVPPAAQQANSTIVAYFEAMSRYKQKEAEIWESFDTTLLLESTNALTETVELGSNVTRDTQLAAAACGLDERVWGL